MRDESGTVDRTLIDLGTRLRALRASRGLTLADLSGLTGISVAMLSHIERGQSSPSLKTLERLRQALDVHLSDFFADAPAPPERARSAPIVRAHQRRKLEFEALHLTKELLSPGSPSELEVLMLVLQEGGNSGREPWIRTGEKAGVVLQGRFELTLQGEVHELEVGDSFQFDGLTPHEFRNLSEGETRVLWIIRSGAPG